MTEIKGIYLKIWVPLGDIWGTLAGSTTLCMKNLLPWAGCRKSSEVSLLMFVTRKQVVLSLY